MSGYKVIPSVQTILSVAQNVTASWADLGSEINVEGYSHIGLWLKVDINQAVNMRIRALAKLENNATDEYTIPIKTIGAADIKITNTYYEFDADADQNVLLEIEVGNYPKYIQLQIQAETAGATPGQIDSAIVTKVWR